MGKDLFKGSVRLGAGHSLIVGHGPKLSKMEFKSEKLDKGIASLGLFNLATPDSISFYKDVTAEDLSPKDEDFIKPVFRGLSEVIVRKNYDPIDFAHETGVLQASMGMIVAQSVYSNHEAFVGNEKGVVSQAFWDKGYKADGVNVPAGFNMEFLIDGKVHTKLARELMAPIPIVHSNSVTVNFGWKQSHPKMSFEEFRGKVATYDDKGELIRRIVTEIYGYHETSLVAHGADPYAQMVKDGKIVNPKYAHARDSFAEAKHQTTFFAFDWKDSFSEFTIPAAPKDKEDDEETQLDNQMKKFPKHLVLLLAALAGVSLSATDTAMTEEDFLEKFDYDKFADQLEEQKAIDTLTSLNEEDDDEDDDEEDKEGLSAQVTKLEGEKAALETKVADLEKNGDAAALTAHKAEVLADVLKTAQLVDKKSADKLKDTYEGADLKTLKAFQTSLHSQLEAKFPVSCKKCGSQEVNRATATEDDEEGKDQKGLSHEEIIRQAQSSGSSMSSIMGE